MNDILLLGLCFLVAVVILKVGGDQMFKIAELGTLIYLYLNNKDL